MFPSYAELHCLTNFTFLRGASHSEELVVRASKLGYSALAITDECSLAGVVRAHVAAKEAGLKLIIGTELTISISRQEARGAAHSHEPRTTYHEPRLTSHQSRITNHESRIRTTNHEPRTTRFVSSCSQPIAAATAILPN